MLYPYTCRRRLEYGLTINPNSEVDDQELMSARKLIREDAPYSGVSMMTGSAAFSQRHNSYPGTSSSNTEEH